MKVDEHAPIIEPFAFPDRPDPAPEGVVGLEPLFRFQHVRNDGEKDMKISRLFRIVDEQANILIGGVAHGSALGHHGFQFIHEQNQPFVSHMAQKGYQRVEEILAVGLVDQLEDLERLDVLFGHFAPFKPVKKEC